MLQTTKSHGLVKWRLSVCKTFTMSTLFTCAATTAYTGRVATCCCQYGTATELLSIHLLEILEQSLQRSGVGWGGVQEDDNRRDGNVGRRDAFPPWSHPSHPTPSPPNLARVIAQGFQDGEHTIVAM